MLLCLHALPCGTFNPTIMETLHNLSDKDLYARCQEYGLNARVWRRRFAGLLPEVQQRELHRRRGYGSLYEFAFKLAGMSSASVDKVLNLASKLEDKPVLREQLESGSQGWSKIEKVAFIATPETDKEWAEKVEKMSAHALGAFVEIQRRVLTENGNIPAQTDVGELRNNPKFQQWGSMTFPVSPEIEKQLRLKKYRLEKEQGITLTYNDLLKLLMEGSDSKEAQVVIQVCPECAARKAAESQGRAIPVLVRRVLQATYHGFCAFPTCTKPATSLHHTKRFFLNPEHDPKSIVPLCKNHERLIHSGLIENEEEAPQNWRLLSKPDPHHVKFSIDQKVQIHRKELILSP